MTLWIDFSVYAAMVVAFWFFFAGRTSGLALQMAADRNEDWLAANRELATTLTRGRWMVGSPWFLWSCHAWGAISLAVLLARQMGLWPPFLSTPIGSQQWEILKDAHSTLLIVGLLYYLGVVVVSSRRVQKDVPLAERRRATLKPRSLADFAPRWLPLTTYALIAVHLAAWIIVGAMGLYSAPGFWVRFAGPVVFSGIFLVVAHASVNRRVSDFFGSHDRRMGVRFGFVVLICGQVMFALRLYGDVAGPSFDVERTIHLALTIMLVVAMVALGRLTRNGQSLHSASA